MTFILYKYKTFIFFTCAAIFLSAACVKAEQDPIFNQYQFNTLIINPAYAGSNDVMSLMILSRHQWIGFEGAPNTQTLTLHSPLNQKRVGLGFSIIRDELLPVSKTDIFADYSYLLNITDYTTIRLGLKAGFHNILINYSKLDQEITTNDNAYPAENFSNLKPNFGFGLYLSGKAYYLGLSIPRLLETDLSDKNNTSSLSNKYYRHYYFIAGTIFNLSNEIKLKPSLITRLSSSTPISTDFNLNALFREKLWIGAMYRLSNALGGLIQYQFSPMIKIGYAYEMELGELKQFNNGTHEIMLNIDFSFKKGKVYNPRYF
ncbi:MAG: type IX secretion system membrane protein PorP/SprF [Marinilabiliaceae bacterium]|nr:type IX secretion system membrane protein PorP/SprF [Marinilabiliaceae bacterium]